MIILSLIIKQQKTGIYDNVQFHSSKYVWKKRINKQVE